MIEIDKDHRGGRGHQNDLHFRARERKRMHSSPDVLAGWDGPAQVPIWKSRFCCFDVLDQFSSVTQPKGDIARYFRVGPVCLDLFVILIKRVSLPCNVLNQSNQSKKKHHQKKCRQNE